MPHTLSFPAHLVRGAGAGNELASCVARLGERVFVLGGVKALAAAESWLSGQLAEKVVARAHYGRDVTWAAIHALTEQVKASGADVLLGVGGGKALDTAKVVAELAGLPVVMLPTLAATCAAVSAVSVIYDEQGHYVGLHKLAKAPDAVILDPALIATAPVRWLAAGLGDTLAKLYEYRAISGGQPTLSVNMAAYLNGQLCYQLIARHGKEACAEVTTGQPGFALEQVMDAIFLYAGFTSIMGVGDHVAAAHAIFDGFTALDKTREFGHGLLVGFGNLCLLALEQRSDDEIAEAIALARDCQVPVALDEIASLDAAELKVVADAACATPDMGNMPVAVSAEALIAAMQRVSALAQRQ